MAVPFKAYDIRGTIPDEINAGFAYRFGQGVAATLAPRRVVVGHDMRMESPVLAQAIVQGLIDCGVDVLPVGLCGTEEVYFHTATSGAEAGLMVTASHNPENYNGIKMVLKDSAAATRENAFDAIEAFVRSGSPAPVTRDYAARGGLRDIAGRNAYIARLLEAVAGLDLRPLKIVCHAGNGCAGPIIDLLEPHLPLTFVKIDHLPDPRLPNGVPNPLLPEKRVRAAQAVIDHGADLGIAFDGDFDRCFFYDHRGRFIEGYYIVGLLAQAMLRRHPGGIVLYDPRLTWNTIKTVERAGGAAKTCPTGHAFFKKMMRETGAIYGGEMSAHHYFRDFYCCDSGMLAWLAVITELSLQGRGMAEMVDDAIAAFPCSGEINFVVEDSFAAQSRVADFYAAQGPVIETIDGLSMAFDEWRFNLRASNTEPLLRLNVETRANKALLERQVGGLSRLVQNR